LRRLFIGALTGVLVLALAASASAVFKQDFSLKFTQKKPAKSTGLTAVLQSSDPDAPGAKPKGVRKIAIKFPAGTLFDTGVPTPCRATDASIQTSNGGVCPRGSKVGAGNAEAVTGFGAGVDPIQESVVAYSNTNEIIFFLRPKGPVGQTLVLRGKLKASKSGPTLTTVVPPLCLPGGSPPECKNGEAVLTKFELVVKGISKTIKKKRRNYVTTPSKCPGSKKWTTKGTFTYADKSIVNVNATTPCSKR
jgi:hypothetical protein